MLQKWRKYKKNEDDDGNATAYLKSQSVLIFDMMFMFKSHLVANTAMSEAGIPVGGVKGPIDKIYWLTKKFDAKTVICVFDGKHSHEKRKQVYEQYKSHRKKANRSLSTPFELNPKQLEHNKKYQMDLLVKILNLLPVKMIIHKKLEADDIIGYLTKQYYKDKGGFRIVVSGDKDFIQLIDKNTSIYNPRKKVLYTSRNMKKYWDTYPKNVIYYRCIEGDASDNVDGIHGVGTKTIEKYFPELTEREIETLDEFLDLVRSKKDELSKTKTGQKIIDGIPTIKRNYKICQLQEVNLSNDQLNKIINSMKYNEFDFKSKYKLDELVRSQNVSKILKIDRLQNFYNLIRI